MNRLKRIIPLSALKLMYDSLILSHLQFGITAWGFEWERVAKLQKRALRIVTNSKYNAHTEPLFKCLNLLKINDIHVFDLQCLKFWHKFANDSLPSFFRDMFQYNNEIHNYGTRSQDRLHFFPTHTEGAKNVLRHHIPKLLSRYPTDIIEKATTHSIDSFALRIKTYIVELYQYECRIQNCYICQNYSSGYNLSVPLSDC